MKENGVQCWDGDGETPPEIAKLIQENQELKDTLRERDEANENLRNRLEDALQEVQRLKYRISSAMHLLTEPERSLDKDDDDDEYRER